MVRFALSFALLLIVAPSDGVSAGGAGDDAPLVVLRAQQTRRSGSVLRRKAQAHEGGATSVFWGSFTSGTSDSDSPSDPSSDVPSDAPSDVPSSMPSMQPDASMEDTNDPILEQEGEEVPSSMPAMQPDGGATSVFWGTFGTSDSDNPSDPSSDVPSDIPSDAPSDVPSDMPSDMPSDEPSSTPSMQPDNSTEDADDPTSVFEQEGEEEEAQHDQESSGLCPVLDFLPFRVPDESTNLFEYTIPAADVAFDTDQDVFLYVKGSCHYEIVYLNRPDTFDNPGDWLNAAVISFGGIPRTTNGAYLTGEAAPSVTDISVNQLGLFYEVHISSESDAVGGDEPLMWGFVLENQAAQFELFLLTIIETAPEIFLLGEAVSCGSGPSCVMMHDDACYFDPLLGELGLLSGDNGSTSTYTNSLQWFNNCAGSLGCVHVQGNSQILNMSGPRVRVEGTKMIWGGNESELNPVEWVRSNVDDTCLLLVLYCHLLVKQQNSLTYAYKSVS